MTKQLYYVDFRTGNAKNAGTDATVTLTLFGANDQPHPFVIKDSTGGYFENSSFDTFKIEANENIGKITKISVKHDNTGTHL